MPLSTKAVEYFLSGLKKNVFSWDCGKSSIRADIDGEIKQFKCFKAVFKAVLKAF